MWDSGSEWEFESGDKFSEVLLEGLEGGSILTNRVYDKTDINDKRDKWSKHTEKIIVLLV